MENAEEVLHFLEEFSKRKPKSIPQELNDYLAYVARTGDPVYQWSLVKSLFKEKLLNVITDFYETTPGLDIPPYPNVEPFNYDIMKNMLLERLDAFTAAPFTVQRICELLSYPRKQYNRIDKFMRAVEKNILVVSTREPGQQRHAELENGDPLEPMVNGSDNNSEYNVDVEMEDMSWKENAEQKQSAEPQPGSSDAHITVDDVETRLQAKQETPMEETVEKAPVQCKSVTPPELDASDEPALEVKPSDDAIIEVNKPTEKTEIETDKAETPSTSASAEAPEIDTPSNIDTPSTPSLVIPEITVDDAEMTEEKLTKQASLDSADNATATESIEAKPAEMIAPEAKESPPETVQPQIVDDSSSDSNKEESIEPKLISEESTSSEESYSSSEITDGNSNSPKPDSDNNIAVAEESNPSDCISEEPVAKIEKEIEPKEEIAQEEPIINEIKVVKEEPQVKMEADNYSITDVKSELPQPAAETQSKSPSPEPTPEPTPAEVKEEMETDVKSEAEEPKVEPEVTVEKEES